MANILEIYKQYKLPPSLQNHQLRVAAVAKLVCDNLNQPIDEKSVVTACLIHDMGNVIKFDFDYAMKLFPDDFNAKNIDYWRAVQAEFASKYGTDEEANVKIAHELDVSKSVIHLIETIGFPKIPKILADGSLEQKIVEYSDMRVSPTGIVSIHDRTSEGRDRYAGRKDHLAFDFSSYERIIVALQEIERQIFANCKIKPAGITDQSALPVIERLKSYTI